MIMQLEALECGAACLAMILAYYKKWVPLELVRVDCGVSRDGSNAGNIVRAARNYGLEASGVSCEPEALRAAGTFPCIVHWEFNHFVVLCGFKGKKAYINDPARGSYTVSMEKFDECFTGVCLQFSPTEQFVPSGKQKSMLSFAAKRLSGTGTAIAFVMISGVISALVKIIDPAFARVFLDKLLTREASGWLLPFICILAVYNILRLITMAVGSIYNYRINGKMAAVGNSSFMWKILRMPVEFFSQRMAGDIRLRQTANATIAGVLIYTVAPALIDFFMMIFYLLIMIRYSVALTAIGLAAVTVNALASRYASKKRVNFANVMVRDKAKLGSFTVSGIESAETVKSSGAENEFMEKWTGYQANVNAQEIKFVKLNAYIGLLTGVTSAFADIAVMVIGTYLAMQGRFTVGMILAFQGFLSSFMSPATAIISSGQTLTEMRTQMERVDDVMEYPCENVFAEENDSLAESKLSGKIEIKDLTFGYSPLGQPIIKNFNMTAETGKSIAIVGASGSGKSTVAKLIAGLYKPWSGEILFDGKPLREIQKSVFNSSVAVADQDIVLFEDTIANNIKMWDESIEDFEMILAARDASLHREIMERPGGYGYRLAENGKNLSGGQRQRMEIARVLAQDPTVLVLDEATSSLDAQTEYDVVRAIKNRGITCIVIAHRLSTVRSCDEIIVLSGGETAGRGTHDELMRECEVYRNLIMSE